ncbi:MAG: hypothetical protein ACTHQ3_02875 [Motilibacteraceae bacterium]
MTSADFHVAWVAALDELELEVDRAEALLRGHDPLAPPLQQPQWVPPQLPGPLPEHLLERARDILDRQLAVSAEIAHTMMGNRRHAAYVRQLGSGARREIPVYVDASL